MIIEMNLINIYILIQYAECADPFLQANHPVYPHLYYYYYNISNCIH